ncbi:MAG TPA: hypothetical protein VFH17_08370 [Coriobacteriia bacterium]|nr:hypothetical protein [Coriobacteriia bacterium]
METTETAYATFSIRLPGELVKAVEQVAIEKVWSRNRTIEQAILKGLPMLETEAARG